MSEFNFNIIKYEIDNYIKTNFDLNIYSINSKYIHTFNTADYAIKIAARLNLNEENIYLAYVNGLFHDIYRFNQWMDYKTFSDHNSIDHGDYGAKLLFEDGLIKNFSIDKKHYEIIKFAVINHNKFSIEKIENNKDNYYKLLHAEIIRDAMLFRGEIKLSPERQSITGITDKILKDVLNNNSVNIKNVKTALDTALSHLAFVFGFHTDAALEIFSESNFITAVSGNYKKYLNKEEYKTLEDITKYVQLYITNRLNKAKQIIV